MKTKTAVLIALVAAIVVLGGPVLGQDKELRKASIMSMQVVFNIVVVVFTVANVAAMGLELNGREALRTLRSAHADGSKQREDHFLTATGQAGQG